MLDPIKSWDTEEVAIWLACIGLETKVNTLRENSVDGDLLLSLTLEDLYDLNFSKLQAKKLLQKVDTTKKFQEILEDGCELSSDNEMNYLESRLEEMKLANQNLNEQLAETQALVAQIEEVKISNSQLCDQLAEKEAMIAGLEKMITPSPVYVEHVPAEPPAPQKVHEQELDYQSHQKKEHQHSQDRQPGVIGGAARGAAGGAVKGAIGKFLMKINVYQQSQP